MLRDARNEPVSSTNAHALELYETALTQFQTYVGDPGQTLIEAAIRSKQHDLARNLVNERLTWKPHSPLAWSFRAKANRIADDTAGAKFAEGEVDKLLRHGAYEAA